jgi:hypothetical protein
VAPAVYVYGIIPSDVTLDRELAGVGDPQGTVEIVPCRDVAALVSELSDPSSLGTVRDLTVHTSTLDSTASAVPVLPMRFGTIMESKDAVISDLLSANHDVFAAALGELDGCAQYIVKGRYLEEEILREILAENSQAARLRDWIREQGGASAQGDRIQLGEIVSHAIAVKREHDTREAAARLEGGCESSLIRPPRHERDAVDIAVLVRAEALDWLKRTVGALAEKWSGRVDLRLLGPMAAYEFVATSAGGGN